MPLLVLLPPPCLQADWLWRSPQRPGRRALDAGLDQICASRPAADQQGQLAAGGRPGAAGAGAAHVVCPHGGTAPAAGSARGDAAAQHGCTAGAAQQHRQLCAAAVCHAAEGAAWPAAGSSAGGGAQPTAPLCCLQPRSARWHGAWQRCARRPAAPARGAPLGGSAVNVLTAPPPLGEPIQAADVSLASSAAAALPAAPAAAAADAPHRPHCRTCPSGDSAH